MASSEGLLAKLGGALGSGAIQPQFVVRRLEVIDVDPDKVIVLRQMRKTFDSSKIKRLAANIVEQGMIHTPTCVFLSPEEAAEHLRVFSLLWGRNYRLASYANMQVTLDGEAGYIFLVAGERRKRSVDHLRKKGVAVLQQLCPGQKPAEAFQTLFKGVMQVSMRMHQDPLRCIATQFAENTPEPVPPYEEAWAYASVYEMLRNAGAKCSYAELGRMVNRGRSVIKRAIEFANQPAYVQQAVADGHLSYAVAHQLQIIEQRLTKKMTFYRTSASGVRLKVTIDAGAELRRWFERAVELSLRARQLDELFRKQVQEWMTGQASLFDTGEEEFDEGGMPTFDFVEFEQAMRRDSAAAEQVKHVYAACRYVERLRSLYRQGKIGPKESAMSTASAQKAVTELVGMLAGLNAEMRWLIEKTGLVPKLELLIAESQDSLELLSQQAG